MEIEKILLPKQTLLLVMSREKYNEDILDSLKSLSGKSVCYVTLNKTYKALREMFEENNIDMQNMIIIDAISKTIKPCQEIEKNCYFVNSPGALTELAIAIDKFLKYGFEYIIFDSLNSLLVYREMSSVSRWISCLVGKIRESGTRAIFYSVNLNGQDDMIKEVSALADKVVDLSEGKKTERATVFTGELKDEKDKNGGV